MWYGGCCLVVVEWWLWAVVVVLAGCWWWSLVVVVVLVMVLDPLLLLLRLDVAAKAAVDAHARLRENQVPMWTVCRAHGLRVVNESQAASLVELPMSRQRDKRDFGPRFACLLQAHDVRHLRRNSMSRMLRHHDRCRPCRSSFYVVKSPNSSQQCCRLGRLTDEARWQLTSIKHHAPLRNLGETPHLVAELRHKRPISTCCERCRLAGPNVVRSDSQGLATKPASKGGWHGAALPTPCWQRRRPELRHDNTEGRASCPAMVQRPARK